MTYPPQQPFGAPAQPGSYAPTAPSAPARPNPFAGVPWSDYVRDGVAAVMLLASLAMPWSYAADATDRIEVVLLTLLSVLSLSAMYLHRLGVIPATVAPGNVALTRALVNAPYVAMAAVYAVIDLVQTFQGDGSARGLGMAAAFGVAGAILAAAPRTSEMALARDPRALAEAWRRVALGVGAFAVASSTLAFVATVINVFGTGDPFASYMPVAVTIAIVFNALMTVAVFAALSVPALKRSAAGRVAAIAVASAFFGATVIDLLSGWSISGAAESGALVTTSLLALGAAYLAAPVRGAMVSAEGIYLYLPALSHLLLGIAVYAVTNAVTAIAMLATGIGSSGSVIALVVLWCVASALFATARAVLRRDPHANRPAVLGLAGGVVVVGVILLVLQAQESLSGSTERTDLTMLIGIPLATAVLLCVPPSIRAYYAPAPLQAHAHSAPVAPAPAPIAVPTPPPAPPVDPYLAAVQNPATDAATLHRIASEAPWLRAHVAVHPQAYPDLLTWLASLGDPAINAALAQRVR